MSLGTYPEVPLADARLRRDDARKLLAQVPPINPSQFKKSQKQSNLTSQANSFELLAREWAESHFVNLTEAHKQRTLRRLEV